VVFYNNINARLNMIDCIIFLLGFHKVDGVVKSQKTTFYDNFWF